jgi:hypothetical protein
VATDTDVVGTDPKPGAEAFTPINTQEELDRVLSARLARERDKYKPENFDKYKQAFNGQEQIKATHQAELLDAVSRAEAAEADAESGIARFEVAGGDYRMYITKGKYKIFADSFRVTESQIVRVTLSPTPELPRED